jgi:hypothetical protein
VGSVLGAGSVVTVSGGSWGARDALDGRVGIDGGGAVEVVITVCGTGAPMVALVVALSPLLRMTAVNTAPIASTPPTTATAGRQRRSAGQASSS